MIRLTNEQRHIMAQGVCENESIQGSARNQFEIEMRNNVGKIPEKLHHACL